jgi:hypothetical protein
MPLHLLQRQQLLARMRPQRQQRRLVRGMPQCGSETLLAP